jgi:hypothetical protein
VTYGDPVPYCANCKQNHRGECKVYFRCGAAEAGEECMSKNDEVTVTWRNGNIEYTATGVVAEHATIARRAVPGGIDTAEITIVGKIATRNIVPEVAAGQVWTGNQGRATYRVLAVVDGYVMFERGDTFVGVNRLVEFTYTREYLNG